MRSRRSASRALVVGSLVAVFALLAACGGARPAVTETAPSVVSTVNWPASVPDTSLFTAPQGYPDLELGVVIFDPATDAVGDEAHVALREVEARLLASTLRDTLTESGNWGAVRVLPAPSPIVPVILSGQILHSDGRDLVVAIDVQDASGEVWLQRTYRRQVDASVYPEPPGTTAFHDLFNAVANDVFEAAKALPDAATVQLPLLSELRYAADLLPEAFGAYLEEPEPGMLAIARLPATSDPMFARINRIRNQEYLFVDTVDEQFLDMRQRLSPVYSLWRQATFEQAAYFDSYRDRAGQRELSAPKGSFAAMQQVYSTYRSVRVQEQDLFELALGFGNEVEDTVVDTGDRVFRLTGTLDSQYDEWRRILAQIFALEMGVTGG